MTKQITLIKKFRNNGVGSVISVSDSDASNLIKMGYAEAYQGGKNVNTDPNAADKGTYNHREMRASNKSGRKAKEASDTAPAVETAPAAQPETQNAPESGEAQTQGEVTAATTADATTTAEGSATDAAATGEQTNPDDEAAKTAGAAEGAGGQ